MILLKINEIKANYITEIITREGDVVVEMDNNELFRLN